MAPVIGRKNTYFRENIYQSLEYNIKLTAYMRIAEAFFSITLIHIGRGSLRLTRVGVAVDVGVCNVSMAVLEDRFNRICQLRHRLSGKLRR